MASITIRRLDDQVKERLRVQAAKAGRSMEEEARVILSRAMGTFSEGYLDGPGLLARMQELFGSEHGAELELPPREPAREPPDFSKE